MTSGEYAASLFVWVVIIGASVAAQMIDSL